MAGADGIRPGANATRLLATHAATLSYDALPPRLVELTKQSIVDTIGCVLAASTLAPQAGVLADYVMSFGGTPESSVLGFGGKVPAPWAALANGGMGHMLDYDDIAYECHVGLSTVVPALALCQSLGHVSGRELITAIACGMDLQVRIDEAVDMRDWTQTEGWFSTQLLGSMAGAATAGRVMRLDPVPMEHALGIAFNQLSGSRQMSVGASTDMRAMQGGFCGHAALLSAQLAQRGITGTKEAIEGRFGFFRTYVRTESPRWDRLLGELGTRFPLLDTHCFKVWPACGDTRLPSAGIQALRDQHGVAAADIASITIAGGTGGTRLLSEPIEQKRRPATSIDAKFSIPFTAAIMALNGDVKLADYLEPALADPAVLAMADRVTYRPADAHWPPAGNVGVEIRTRAGEMLRIVPQHFPGDPAHRVGWAEIEAKFRECASYARIRLHDDRLDEVIAQLRVLESLPDVSEVIDLLC
jgi:2-methylcitrate dehydratase PrpD